MKKIIFAFVSVLMLNFGLACMPYSPVSLKIGTFQNSYQEKFPNQLFQKDAIGDFVKIDNISGIFKFDTGFGKKYFHFVDDKNIALGQQKLDFSKYQSGDKIIFLSDIVNGTNSTTSSYELVSTVGKLKCENGKLNIVDSQGFEKDFDNDLWQCGNYKPQVMTRQQLLEKLEQKYNFCGKYSQNIDPNLIKALSYDQLLNARKNLALKWDNLTTLQKLKAKKYLVLIKQKLDEFSLQNQNFLSGASSPDFLSGKTITTIVSGTNLTTHQLLDWQSKLQSKPTSGTGWVFSSSYVGDPTAKWIQIVPEQDFLTVDWTQFSQYNSYFN